MESRISENAVLKNSEYDLKLSDGAIVGLRRVDDSFDTDYILPGRRLGDVILRYRQGSREWTQIDTKKPAADGQARVTGPDNGREYGANYAIGAPDLTLAGKFELAGGVLIWTIELSNETDEPVEIGDLALPFDMNTAFAWNKPATESVFKHSFISGHCSYMFWMRPNSVGPYLTMTPFAGTHLEYYDAFRGDTGEGSFKAYIHSAAEGAVAKEKGCNWRQPNTSVVLSPKGAEGDHVVYGFKFQWADDYDAVRRIIVDEGLIDIQVVPGMTVPCDLFARFSMRTRQQIAAVESEFPGQTSVEHLGKADDLIHLYQVKFTRLGENKLTVKYGDGRHMFLEFFVTQPLETLIKKRAAFIKKCQHRDESKWYNGLISEWNMETKVLLGPDNYDRIKGWRIYEVTCDDPGLCKPSYLAAKNAEYPVPEEVEALDYYIENFMWGGLQCTDQEEYPYGIYGIPDWKVLRDSPDLGPKGRTHIWRIYDYPHIVLLYLSMYQIAKRYPHIRTYLDASQYLERAYNTAVAMFTIPWETREWTAYQTGLYNELCYTDVIDALEAEGLPDQAFRLRKHWEKKVKYFVCDNPNMFGSEYPFDSTGFESTHAFAGYAIERVVDPESVEGDKKNVITLEAAWRFMEMQTACNIFCRGWLEPAYFWLGSDYRGGGNTSYTLSYMAQMGGWSLLDYALYYAKDPYPYLRLAYASYLSSWALMNAGTPESNYGFWYPGVENDGGAGGGFEPTPYGYTWLEQPHSRGSWYYACEIDLGFSGGLRMASTVVADDPLFGMFCYGGDMERKDGALSIVPKDGLRKRFHAVIGGHRAHFILDTDHFALNMPIIIAEDLSQVRFVLDNEGGHQHAAVMTVSGLPAGKYGIMMEGHQIAAFDMANGASAAVALPLESGSRTEEFTIKRQLLSQ